MILCCGEALIDLLPGEEGEKRPLVGGSVLNTAVALGRLGAEVGLLTGLSSDNYGKLIEDHLHASNVSTDFSVRSDRPTTLAIVTLVNGQAQYTFEDDGSALRMIEIADLPDIPNDVEAMVFGGISLIPAPVADTLAHLCVERPENVVGMLDANVRPAFVDDPETYRNRLKKMMQQVDIVKVSDEDLEWLAPQATSSEEAIEHLLNSGPSVILFTEGAEGASAHRKGRPPVHATARPVEIVDTVGAGDTFNAGILHALKMHDCLTRGGCGSASDATWANCLTFANKAAAITVSRAGANPPWAHELSD